ncbi:hypothetical protein M3J07_010663 [Ascochyta lentis]
MDTHNIQRKHYLKIEDLDLPALNPRRFIGVEDTTITAEAIDPRELNNERTLKGIEEWMRVMNEKYLLLEPFDRMNLAMMFKMTQQHRDDSMEARMRYLQQNWECFQPDHLVQEQREQLQLLALDDPQRLSALATLTWLLEWAFEETRKRSYLDDAVANAEQVIAATSTEDLTYSERLMAYVAMVSKRPNATHEQNCGRLLTELQRDACALDNPDRESARLNLEQVGQGMLQCRDGRSQSLREILAMRLESNSIPSEDDNPGHPGEIHGRLGVKYHDRYFYTQDLKDVDNATYYLRMAEAGLDPRHALQEVIRKALVSAALLKATHTKEASDFANLISVATCGPSDECCGDASAPFDPLSLCKAYYCRYEAYADIDDLMAALSVAQTQKAALEERRSVGLSTEPKPFPAVAGNLCQLAVGYSHSRVYASYHCVFSS